MHIQHLTLPTGHIRRIEAGEVSGETLARVRPWLASLVHTGDAIALPVSSRADYTGLATVEGGALLVTISGPIAPWTSGRRPPLVTIGVARRSRHGAALWPLMTGPVMPRPHPAAKRPAEPWCAVTLWPMIAMDLGASMWLGDLERCIAWAWCTSPDDGDAK